MLTQTRLAIAALLLTVAAPAAAQTVCGTRDSVLKQLSAEYQEAPVGIGLANNGAVVELLTSTAGTWTILVTMPKGQTCLMGTGEAWQPVARKVALTDRES